jgi:GT2 family glycosyltransferase
VEAKKSLKEKKILYDSSSKTTAIILLNYNGLAHLENYLPDLVQYTPKAGTQIWIVDNNSTDLSIDWIQETYPEIFTMELKENYGYAGGYNRALEKIDADYFVILNNDVRVTKNWLPPLIQRLESHPDIASVQPKIKSERSPDKFEYAGAAGGEIDKWGYPFCRGRIFDTIEVDEGQYEEPEPIFWSSGAAMIIKSDLFLRAGGFDPSFFAHQEEIDLSWRLLRAGYRVFYEPKSEVFHLGGGTLSYNAPHKVYLNFRNNLTTLIKNEPSAKCFWLLPLRFFLDTIAALKFLFDKNTQAAKSVFRAYGFIIVNMSHILAKRKLSAARVRKIRSSKNNKSRVGYSRFNKSIVFQYFIRNKKTFRQLQNT